MPHVGSGKQAFPDDNPMIRSLYPDRPAGLIVIDMETCIRLRSLIKEYGSTSAGVVRAVDGIDLDVGSGEIVALLGPNGAGKTTTLDMILGFIEPSDGEVTVFGRSPRQAVADGKVSAVLQTGGLLRDLTVGETVELVASIYRQTTGPGADTVADVLERTGLTERATRLVKSCSGGEQQRLRFALALLADPDLLLLDEPTAGMDVEARRSFWAAMETEADRGRTIVFATHYLQEAEDFARRTVLLSGGRIVADGPTDQIRRRAVGLDRPSHGGEPRGRPGCCCARARGRCAPGHRQRRPVDRRGHRLRRRRPPPVERVRRLRSRD